jgi:hypothetical protein
LLAYLDDTLEPSEAKLIGQKVAESDAAQELIARIKQVTRRRRLTSPPATGPGVKLDPNLIAEYLDNVLTPDQLAEVEETCLASDTHLAEVAAAHQILTLVLGEPALVPPTARQRMYGLIHGREAIPNRKASTASVGQGAIEPAHAGADDADDTLLLGLSLSRPGSWARWLLPVVAACLLLAAGLAIWMAVSPGIRPPVPSNKMPVDNSAALVLANPNQTVNSAEQTDKSKTEPPVVSDKKNEQQKNEATAAQKTEVESKTTKTTDKSEEAAKKTAAETKPAPKPPAVLPPRTERHDVARMTIMPNWPSVLLQQTTDRPAWQRLRPESRVFTTDLLMSLPGYRSQLLTDNGVQLLLRGNLPQLAPLPVLESAIVLYQNADVDVDFKLDRGLVLLSNQKATGPAHARVRFHNEVWDVTLPDRGTEVGVELTGACRPYSKEPGGTEPGSRLTVYALKGKPALQIRYRDIPLPVPSLFIWDSNYGTAPGPKPLEGVPDWAVNKVAPQNKDVQGIESALKSLASRLIAKDATDVVLGEALHDEDPAGRVVAVHCLGAVGDWSNLIDALAVDVERRWDLRILAIHELRFLLGQDAKNDQKLFFALKQKNYKDAQAQTVLELLHGYNEDDWTNPGTRAAVVDYLMSDKLAIRQLTHFLLASLIPEGRKIPYDPAGDSDQRERGYTEWRKVVLGVKPGGGKAKGS